MSAFNNLLSECYKSRIINQKNIAISVQSNTIDDSDFRSERFKFRAYLRLEISAIERHRRNVPREWIYEKRKGKSTDMVVISSWIIKQKGNTYIYIYMIINIDLRRCKSLSLTMAMNERMRIQREHLYRYIYIYYKHKYIYIYMTFSIFGKDVAYRTNETKTRWW